jgi:hypothetical protein
MFNLDTQTVVVDCTLKSIIFWQGKAVKRTVIPIRRVSAIEFVIFARKDFFKSKNPRPMDYGG